MAKIKLKFGENEIEIESRDFYVDNQTLGEVIDKVTTHLEENRARIVYEDRSYREPEATKNTFQSSLNYLKTLDDAEIHEPEYSAPVPILAEEIRDKLKVLINKSFFNKPRTASETVSELRENGWAASPLHVSTILAKMAFNKEILKNSHQNRSYYFAKEALLIT